MTRPATVYLVGAGPGDPSLMTLRGAELLRQADVVIYDRLANPELLRGAAPTAELIYGGKHGPEPVLPQAELNALMIAKARAGKRVVRLKGGDPYMFGRGGEEAQELQRAGIGFEVVPGVSSVEAVPNYAGIPLTHRELASVLTVVTGHEDPDKECARVDWGAVARAGGTLVVMMGMKRLRQIAEMLVAHGRPAATPAAVIRWGTLGRQQVLSGTLGDIAGQAEERGWTSPALIVVGEVVRLRGQLNWFERRPLFGRRVVVTRARAQAAELAGPLRERGAEVLEVPAIRIGAPAAAAPIAEALAGLNAYDWIVYTSANGVDAFFQRFFARFHDMRDIGGVRIAAVGPGTAARLRQLHLQVDVMPEQNLGRSIVQALAKFESLDNLRILLPRAEQANPDLPRLLEEKGAIVDDIAFYRTEPDLEDGPDADRLEEEGADWITFTSGSTAEHFHRRFDLRALCERFPRMRLASIGPETSKALAALGVSAHAQADPHTVEGLIDALVRDQSQVK